MVSKESASSAHVTATDKQTIQTNQLNLPPKQQSHVDGSKPRCKIDDEDSDDSEFECVLGGNGQVVLWSSKYESILSRFEFTPPKYLANRTLLEGTGDDLSDQELNFLKKDEIVVIEHQTGGTVDLVGEQIWRGALFLADFILHNPRLFHNKHVLEVASGVGLTSIIAGILAKQVIVTDVDRGDILDLVNRNVNRNKEYINAEVEVREIDFYNHKTIECMIDSIRNTQIILAADIIYENPLTDGFFDTALNILSEPPDKVLYIALEKRFPEYNKGRFEADYPLYEYFLDKLDWIQKQKTDQIEWIVEQIKSPIPQYFFYEPTNLLVLWRVQAKLKLDKVEDIL